MGLLSTTRGSQFFFVLIDQFLEMLDSITDVTITNSKVSCFGELNELLVLRTDKATATIAHANVNRRVTIFGIQLRHRNDSTIDLGQIGLDFITVDEVT